jgi:type 1 fimbriae regulatory protein FimB/type 1 fimbriae regulatory protein FimE
LTPAEVAELTAAALKVSRYGHRNATAILLAYRHGLRVSELCSLTWAAIDLKGGLIHIARLKHGVASTHPLAGDEMRALRRLKREQDGIGRFVFLSERGAPMTRSNFLKALDRIAAHTTIPFKVHPHMLRHACGFKLANDGRDTRSLQHYLGHRNIKHTTRYTELDANRFNGWWTE